MKPGTTIPPVCVRIKQLPQLLGISEYKIAKTIQKPQSVLQAYYKRGYTPSYEVLQLLCTRFNLDANWLLLGKPTTLKTQISHT